MTSCAFEMGMFDITWCLCVMLADGVGGVIAAGHSQNPLYPLKLMQTSETLGRTHLRQGAYCLSKPTALLDGKATNA